MKDIKKEKIKEARKYKDTLGIEVNLFEMRGLREEVLASYRGKFDNFWKDFMKILRKYR